MELHLMRPEWLWSLLPAVALALLLWRQRGRSGSWSAVIAPDLLPFLVGHDKGSRAPNLLPVLFLGWLLAAVAASGPSWEKIPQPLHQKQDALVLVLDLSYSMKSTDLPPSRLDRARQKLLDLLERRREGQTGLVAYAGDSHIVTPLTDDTATIANLLPALNPDMMPVPGSAPVAAVTQAVELLHSAGVSSGKILLLTDAVDSTDHKALAKALAGSGAQLGIMGLGTASGAPIPLPRGGFLKDSKGTIVMPALDERNLRHLAAATDARYMRMQIDVSDLDYLLADTGLPGAAQTLALDRTADTWEDQGYLLVLALLPLVLALFRRGWVLCLLPLLFVARPMPASALGWDDLWLTRDQQAQQALQQGNNAVAAALFEDRDWAGTAAYRDGDFEAATEHFSATATADGWYNRGNALARAGRIDEAMAAYRESLKLQPAASDAQDNLDLLEQLQQQQQQQQQQSDQGEQNNKENSQQQQGQDQQQQEGQPGDESQQQAQQRNQDQQQGEQGQESEPSGGSEREPQERRENGRKDEEPDTARDEKEQQSQAQPGEPATPERDQAAAVTGDDPEEQERDQAMEQWLRRVPDDPSGLLREKFRYESQQRQQQEPRKDDEIYW